MYHHTHLARWSHRTRPHVDELEPRSLLTIGFPGDGVLDITLIGDQYTNMAQWHADEARIASYLLSVEPFHSRADQIQINEIDNTQSLGAYRDPSMARLLMVDYAKAESLVEARGIKADLIGVIVNTPDYGGSGGAPVCVSYNGDLAPQVFLHEFVHAFGGLEDEYTYGTTKPIDNQVHANVYAGTPPAAAWAGLVAPDEYFPGGEYNNWYRSSLSSLMSSVSVGESIQFNVVSLRILSSKLDYWAGPPTDHQAPQVAIVGLHNGEAVSGVVHVATNATDDRAVTDTQLWVDGSLVRNDWTAPFTLDWLTGEEPLGSHTLQVKAFDASGNVGESSPVTVDLTAGADMQIVSPVAGFQVTGTAIPIEVSMWRDGADQFSVSIDGTPANSWIDHQTGKGTIWLTNPLGLGTHTLTVVASIWNPAANKLEERYRASTTIQGSGSSLIVGFRTPAAGATVTGKVTLAANVTAGHPVLVEYFVDGAPIRTSRKAPFALKWNSKRVGDGQHTLSLVAIDASGVRWSTAQVVTVKNHFDRKPPTVTMAAPRKNATIRTDVLVVRGKAKDDVAVARVELLIDQQVVAATTAPKFTFTSDVGSLVPGKHQIRVRAYDTSGKVGWSKPIVVKLV